MAKTRTVPLFYKRKTADQKKEWRVCIQDPFENCEKIYPIQQKKVKQMINNIKEDSNVEKIVVFGSSVQDTCHMGSDVDFYIVLKQDQKITFKETLSFMYDIWTNYTVDSRMYEEITKKGVTVYERYKSDNFNVGLQIHQNVLYFPYNRK